MLQSKKLNKFLNHLYLDESFHTAWRKLIMHPDDFLRYFFAKLALIVWLDHQYFLVDAVVFQACFMRERSGDLAD